MTLVSCWLMTYGLSFIMALTHGPFGICGALREKIQEKYQHVEWIRDGIECPVCISFWCGIVVALVFGDDVLRTWLSSVGFVCVVSAMSPD